MPSYFRFLYFSVPTYLLLYSFIASLLLSHLDSLYFSLRIRALSSPPTHFAFPILPTPLLTHIHLHQIWTTPNGVGLAMVPETATTTKSLTTIKPSSVNAMAQPEFSPWAIPSPPEMLMVNYGSLTYWVCVTRSTCPTTPSLVLCIPRTVCAVPCAGSTAQQTWMTFPMTSPSVASNFFSLTISNPQAPTPYILLSVASGYFKLAQKLALLRKTPPNIIVVTSITFASSKFSTIMSIMSHDPSTQEN